MASLGRGDLFFRVRDVYPQAYKIRGWAYRTLGQWDSALKVRRSEACLCLLLVRSMTLRVAVLACGSSQDLVTGQGIDYDESMRAMQLLVQSKVDEKRAEGARAQAERAEVSRRRASLSFLRGCTCGGVWERRCLNRRALLSASSLLTARRLCGG